jgi:hypothetical protein
MSGQFNRPVSESRWGPNEPSSKTWRIEVCFDDYCHGMEI